MTKFYDMWFTSGNMNSVCEHGSQRRKCVDCESAWQYEIIDKLEADNKRLHEKNRGDVHDLVNLNSSYVAMEERLTRKCDKLESENKRLREALEAISLMESPAPHVKDIVRQSLEER